MYDCTEYGVNELSLIINNDEFLYLQRYRLTKDCLEEYSIKFTDEQWEVFQNDLREEE